MKELHSTYQLGKIIPNIATFLKRNATNFSDKYVYKEKDANGIYRGIIWEHFYNDIKKKAAQVILDGFFSFWAINAYSESVCAFLARP